MSSDSGRLTVGVHRIYYDCGRQSWSIPISDLLILGEYTNNHGPLSDDWFYVFITAPEREWYEASAYADGTEIFLTKLASVLHVEKLELGLANSTDWASRIIYPPNLADQELLTIKRVPSPGGSG
jgi:hypothetical protein